MANRSSKFDFIAAKDKSKFFNESVSTDEPITAYQAITPLAFRHLHMMMFHTSIYSGRCLQMHSLHAPAATTMPDAPHSNKKKQEVLQRGICSMDVLRLSWAIRVPPSTTAAREALPCLKGQTHSRSNTHLQTC